MAIKYQACVEKVRVVSSGHVWSRTAERFIKVAIVDRGSDQNT